MQHTENTDEIYEADNPVLPALQDVMNADVVVSDKGVSVFHDRPLSDRLEYVEFNSKTGELSFIFRWGKVQRLGEAIAPKHRDFFMSEHRIYVIYGQSGEVKDFYHATLVKN